MPAELPAGDRADPQLQGWADRRGHEVQPGTGEGAGEVAGGSAHFRGLQQKPQEGAGRYEEESGRCQTGSAQQPGKSQGTGGQSQPRATAAEACSATGVRTQLLQVRGI